MGLRLRLFNRIPYLWATVFATALAVVQLLERTNPVFALCSFVYILLATTAFNIAGGLTTLPGIYIFANALLTCIIGITTKALLGEPGQTNLKDGVGTLEIYALGMLGMLAAVLVERRFRAKRPFVATALPIQNMDAAFLGCALVGLIGDIYFTFHGKSGPGTLSSAFAQLNQFGPLAIILGTMQAVRKSQGRRNLSLFLVFLLLFYTARGFLGFSKQGIFAPAVAWLIGMVAAEYRLKVSDLVTLAVVMVVMVRIGVPFSQFGRRYRIEDAAPIASLPQAIYLLQNFDLVTTGYAEDKTDSSDPDSWRYFNADVGQVERLSMLPPDDALIHFTDEGHVFGFKPSVESFENQVPHFLWKDKPIPTGGNAYWHEMGLASEDDYTTGIAFSITADVYHQGGLAGILVEEPLLLSLIFLVWSFVLGGTRQHPANLMVALLVSHYASEGGTTSAIDQKVSLGGVLLVAVACRYVFPVIGSILQRRGPQVGRRLSRRNRPSPMMIAPVTNNRQARNLG